STFRLRLPETVIGDAPARAAGEAPPEPAHASPPGAEPGRILIAEDDLTNRIMLARLLRRIGYEPPEASNGREALAIARDRRPAAILMDVLMPVMDGIDATLALRADPRTRDIPILALTGDLTLTSRRRIASAGVDGFLEKPIEP